MRTILNITLILLVSTVLYRCAEESMKEPEENVKEQCKNLPNLQCEELKKISYDIETLKKLAGKTEWKKYDMNPILEPGGEGEWDAGALGSMTVIRVGDILHLYYEAWGVRHDIGWPVDDYLTLQIGHAISPDGVHWMKDPANPVIPRGEEGEWDRNGTWDPFVIYEDGVFKMWYGAGVNFYCEFGYAVSEDGSDFTKMGQISHVGRVEDDHVVHDLANKRYYMYYWHREYLPMALFRAESHNEMDFDFENAVNIRIEGEEYPGMYKFNHVFMEDDVWYMYYSDCNRFGCEGSRVRYATSTDGLNWKSKNRDLLDGLDGEVLKFDDDLYFLYYGRAGYFDEKDQDIRVAVYSGDLDDLALEE